MSSSFMSTVRQFAMESAFGGMCFCLLLSLSDNVKAQQVINFEGLTAAPVLNQYASQGVTFNGPLATDFSSRPGFAHSGTGGIQLCFAQEFCSAPLTVTFTTGQAHAKLWIGFDGALNPAQSVTLQAKDSGGAVLNQITVTLGPSAAPIPINIPMEINTPTANIRQLVLRFDGGPGVTTFNNGLLIDDVEFSTAGPTPACSSPVLPTIALTQPGQPAPVQIDEFMLQGNVQTATPLDAATLTVTRPGGSTKSFNLLNSGISLNGGNFGATRVSGMLLPGQNTVTVRVRNCAGNNIANATVVYSPIAAGTGFKFLAMEVTQVTQDLNNSVPLVAGKPTVVRVYLNVTGPTTSIAGISGALIAARPGGATLVPLLRSKNSITVDSTTSANAQRLNMNATLNFVLPPSWVAPSTLNFKVSKLFINGHESNLACDGCGNLDSIGAPKFVQFRPTKPLNLVLAPYEYTRSTTPTPDIFFTPMGALQWLNNVYPVSGNFPSASGIRLLRILPTRTTNKNLVTSSQAGDFLDDLEDILSDLQDQNEWPSDARLLAMTPFGGGGRARMSGKVSFVDTWAVENGVVPQANFEGYGDIWSHELGHNFGRKHLSNSHGEMSPVDLGSPTPHGGIGNPGVAISTNYWLASAPSLVAPGVASTGNPHAHDFMSYGRVNSPGGEHTRSWVSPHTYKALFKSFEDLTPTSMSAPAPRIEKLVVAGRINENGTATLRPFRRVTTGYVSGSGADGEYFVVLLDANRRTLFTYRFVPQETEDSKLLSFSEYVPWRNGTQRIEIRKGSNVIAERSVSKNAPKIRLMSPKKGDAVGEKLTIAWRAEDEDNDTLTYTVLYNSGVDSIWIPIANGVKETTVTVATALLPGSSRARIRVRATDGVNTTETESEMFEVEDKHPRVAILSPTPDQILDPDAEPRLVGVAYDPEDGVLEESSLTWTSDRDGVLDTSDCRLTKPLSRGRHVITLTATDSSGNSVTSRVNVRVGWDRLRGR